jgi:hypothetical protein
MRIYDLSHVHQRTNNPCGLSCLSTHVPDLSIPSGLAPVRRRGVIHPSGDSLLYLYSYSYFSASQPLSLSASQLLSISASQPCVLHRCLAPRCLLVRRPVQICHEHMTMDMRLPVESGHVTGTVLSCNLSLQSALSVLCGLLAPPVCPAYTCHRHVIYAYVNA